MIKITIDKNIPLPPKAKRGKGARHSALWGMDVGDSVFFAEKLPSFGRFARQRKAGWKISCRKVTEYGIDGHRYWRIA